MLYFTQKMTFSAAFVSENVSCLPDNTFTCDSIRQGMDDKFSPTNLQNHSFKTLLLLMVMTIHTMVISIFQPIVC